MKKILLVDDEPEIRDALKDFLEDQDYAVVTASTGAEALEMISKESPQAVLMDVIMPDMDGITCLKQIKKADPGLIVVLISGLQNESVAKDAIRHGAYDYIAKPFDFEDLNSRILSRIF